MNIIKEHCKGRNVIRTRTYASSLQHLVDLYTEAKKDFPHLSMKDVNVVRYGGRRYRSTMGIEWSGEQTDGYDTIKELELTL